MKISGRTSWSGQVTTVHIRAVDGSNLPTGADLATGVATPPNDFWANHKFFGFNRFQITAGTKYAIIVSGSGIYNLSYIDNASLGASSTDSGANWTGNTRRYHFRMYGTVEDPVVDTGNLARQIEITPNYSLDAAIAFDVLAGAGTVTFGIAVGTGNTAVTITDHVLETPIAHGTGAGQLQYGAVTFGAPASDATTSQFTITRDFANGSSGTITVKEIALYARCCDQAGTTRYFMLARDVITDQAVTNGQTLTVNYRPQVTI
jgi:hypothetical protein